MVRTSTIAIIGGGFSGTMVATHLLRLADRPLQIELIEKRSKIGQGVAYSTSVESHVLNVPAAKMSAFPDVPDHFLNWIQDRYPEKNFVASTFVPRRYYGEYLQSVLQEARNNARNDVQLNYSQNEAISAQPSAVGNALRNEHNQIIITCHNGETIEADRVVLALGNLPPSDPPIGEPSFYQSGRYISWAWSTPLENTVDPEDSILLVGSGLTAIDLAVDLHRKGHQGKIYLISRRGLLPQPHQPTTAYPSFIQVTGTPPVTGGVCGDRPAAVDRNLNGLFKQVRQEVKKAQEVGYDWRSVIDSLRPHTQTLWKSLSLTERRRFLRHLRAYWDIHRHRIAPEISQTIAKLRNSQQLILHAGQIQSYQEENDGVKVTIRARSSDRTETLKVQTVVNCTGSERLASQWQHPLLNSLLASGLAQTDPLQLGLDVSQNGALVKQISPKFPTLYTLGSLQKGCLWETTAVPEIRQQAKKLAEELLNFSEDNFG